MHRLALGGRADVHNAKQANKHLKQLCEDLAPDGVGVAVRRWFVKVTDEECAFTMAVARPDSAMILGQGIIKMYGVFFEQCLDRNRKQPRLDILIASADGMGGVPFARLHPGAKDLGVSVVGDVRHWATDELYNQLVAHSLPLDSTQGHNAGDLRPMATATAQRRSLDAFTGIHQNEVISPKRACIFLRFAAKQWAAKAHPRGPFSRPVNTSEFLWQSYMAGRAVAREWTATDFGLMSHDAIDMPCFSVKTTDDEQFLFTPLVADSDERSPLPDDFVNA